MRSMLDTLARRIRHPLQTALDVFGGGRNLTRLAGLKQRLLRYADLRTLIPPRIELQSSKNGRYRAGPPSDERHLMQLYVVRHGIAVEGGDGIPDAWRALSDKGRRRFQKTARTFGKLGHKLDLILTS